MRTNTYIQVADDAYPSVASIVNKAVSQAKQNTNGFEYEMALYLHDWLLNQLEYDNSLKWSSAESALTRGVGTCQAYESAYSKLLTAVGIINSETRDTYDGHTWNAVKLDGKWYQVDCTWDDTSDNFYGDLDQRHLYFCITDELMAIAHKGHAKIYTADGYATRSTSLKDNYFVHNGKADEWAAKYADRIQQHLDAKENKFSIDADNQSFPPSISGIQNGIVAFAMNLREWKTTNAKADLAANSIVAMQSGYKWISRFDFYATWKEPVLHDPLPRVGRGARRRQDDEGRRGHADRHADVVGAGLLLRSDGVRGLEGPPRLRRRVVRHRRRGQRQVGEAGRRGAAGGAELLPLRRRGEGVGHGPLGQSGLLRHLDRKQRIRLDHSGAI